MASLMTVSGLFDNISFMSNNITGNLSSTVDAQAATPAVTATKDADKFSWDNASVYFLLTDRFRNGNTSNDHSYRRGLDQNGNTINVSDDRGLFHGGDFKGITETIKEGYFNDLGVNALWISAPYEQIHGYIVGGDGSPSFAHYSYHGYYVLDYTNTDANFGTEEEFKELVDTAHEHGLRVIIDIVMNHAGYNSLYDMNEFGFGDVKDGWEDYYFDMSNVNNKDYHSYIDYETSKEKWGKWWGDWVRAGLPGYTAGGGSALTQCLAGLPDFKTESTSTVTIPEFLANKWKSEGRYDKEVAELKNYLSANGYQMTVTNCISYWLSTWVRDYGVDGFRCDTAKHVENTSWAVLEKMCTEALRTWKSKNPTKKLDDLDFWMTGEAWDHTVSYDEYYTVGHFDSMINFETTGGGLLAGSTISGIYQRYADTINSKDDFNVLSYISSHDSTLARGDMIYYGSAFLLLPGGIQIFYGDETNRGLVDSIPFDGNGGAGHSLRSDMNWDSMDEAVLAHWQKVGQFRNSHVAVGAGQNTEVSSTAGSAFVRTYSKDGVTDRVAGCIAAGSNTAVTIDVSAGWKDGESVVNYYDNSSAIVTDGKVTFNSGANGTILIADPDGKPLLTFEGAAKFKGTQQVTVSLKDATYATVSIDGGNKVKVVNGTKLTIGSTAYEGDTITLSYSATNEKGTINGKATFYKAYADEDISGSGSGSGDDDVTNGIVKVKVADGSAPYVYAWSGTSKDLLGAWPGTRLSVKDSEGYYYVDLGVTGTYNIVINNGSGAKTDDIEGLKGETKFDVASGYTSYTLVGGSQNYDPIDNTITIRVKPYGSQVPYLYVWDSSKTYNGGFPGRQLTEKDENGNYIFVVEGAANVSCIVSGGSNQSQSDDITGISAEALITVNSSDYSDISVEKTQKPESKFSLMKKEARYMLIYDSSDYTSASWNKFTSYKSAAEALIAKGEKEADADAVTDMYNKLSSARSALVLAAPTVTTAAVSGTKVSGKAAPEATVTVTYNSKKYTATANQFTGAWSVTVPSLANNSTVSVSAARNGLSSASKSYTVPVSGTIDPDPTVPGIVSLGTISNVANGLKITWSKVTDADGYYIYRKTTGGYSKIATINNASTLVYIDENAKGNTSYTYTVRAYNDAGNGKYDTTGITLKRVLSPDVKAISNSTGGIKVEWNTVTGATGYEVLRRVKGGTFKAIAKLTGGNITKYIDATAVSGQAYIYTVRAVSGTSKGYMSSKALYMTRISTPVISSVKNTTSGIKITWAAQAEAEGFTVYRKEGTSGTYTQIATVSGGKYTYTDTTAVTGKTYSYYIKANIGKYKSTYDRTEKSIVRQ